MPCVDLPILQRILMSILALVFALASAASPDASTPQWETIQPGMQQASVPVSAADSAAQVIVLRFDPHEWQLEFAGSDGADARTRTAREWAKQADFSAVINAGMFRRDYKTHVGFAQFRGQLRNDRVNDYQSVAAFDPRDAALPAFHIFDLDAGSTMADILKDYGSAVQNLRLIQRRGVNKWQKQTRRWSEAALAEDDGGRVLFIFCRAAYSMHDLNQLLLSAGIGVVAAQHLEGGPEAQLYLHAGAVEREWFGSYETAFSENDANVAAWPIPNVLGMRRRTP